ncbi:hypothetical protein [Paludisphaera mucosa]|uniref:Uncharacterized protein n=1 Tax=Paludisphaera mucosa TaxID=3030827 RepID=A0ABT6FJZ0_9BACT|nr:hypothetical protein [Paludisphaera mucosa]MDG3007897.1 hypothetical protein [Paludisphaera mucosa]
MFAEALDAKIDPAGSWEVHLAHGGTAVDLPGRAPTVTLGPKAKPFGTLRETADASSPTRPAAAVATLGKGRIAATFFPMGRAYSHQPDATARRFLDDLVRELAPEPIAVVNGSTEAGVDVHLARKGGKLLVNLVNTSGPHRTEPVFDAIPPVGPLGVAIRVASRPAKVSLQPAGVDLPFTYEDGRIRLTVPKVDVHEIVVIEPAE